LARRKKGGAGNRGRVLEEAAQLWRKPCRSRISDGPGAGRKSQDGRPRITQGREAGALADRKESEQDRRTNKRSEGWWQHRPSFDSRRVISRGRCQAADPPRHRFDRVWLRETRHPGAGRGPARQEGVAKRRLIHYPDAIEAPLPGGTVPAWGLSLLHHRRNQGTVPVRGQSLQPPQSHRDRV
jgi:hypothetical protein